MQTASYLLSKGGGEEKNVTLRYILQLSLRHNSQSEHQWLIPVLSLKMSVAQPTHF